MLAMPINDSLPAQVTATRKSRKLFQYPSAKLGHTLTILVVNLLAANPFFANKPGILVSCVTTGPFLL